MKITNYKNSEKRANPFNADVRILHTDNKIDFLHLELEPGKMLAKVRIEIPAYFYVLEGTPEVIINEELVIATKEDFVFCPAGSEHCINNPGAETARVLVIKVG